MYQVLWVRMFGLTFGVTIFAVSIVLSSFMGGLALGSYIFGRLIDRGWNPLKLFSLLEIGIGVCGFLSPVAIHFITDIYIFLNHSLGENLLIVNIFRFIISFVLLLIPTSLMGGTLPVLSKFLIERQSRVGWNVGMLYFVNDLGAVLGCLLAGFLLIELIGVTWSLFIAALINILVAVAVLLIRKPAPAGDQPEIQPEHFALEISSYKRWILLLALTIFGISGAICLSYEVIWTRILNAATLQNSSYSFAAVVATFILGLSIGGIIGGKLSKTAARSLSVFGIAEVGIGATALLTIPFYASLRFQTAKIVSELHFAPPWDRLLVEAGISALIMFLPAILMGMTFPLVSQIYTTNLQTLGKKIGIIGCLNTLGSIVGALIPAFLLIPIIGLFRSVLILSFLNITMGVILIFVHPDLQLKRKSIILIPAVILMFVIVMIFPLDVKFWKQRQGYSLVYYNEDPDATVVVSSRNALGRVFKIMEVNGHGVAGTAVDTRTTQKLQAHLPLLIHGAAQSALTVGFGSGDTWNSIRLHGTPEADAIELVKGVIEAAYYFPECNEGRFEEPGRRIIIEDGRNYTLVSTKSYDAIMNDSVHPGFAGNANLYTQDYFQSCKNRLTETGVMSSWVPLFNLSLDDLKMIIKTFQSVFPHTSIWCGEMMHLQLIGTKEPLKIDFDNWNGQFQRREVSESLSVVGFSDPLEVLNCFIAGEDTLRAFTEGASIHSEAHPKLDFTSARALEQQHWFNNIGVIAQLKENVLSYVSCSNTETCNEISRRSEAYRHAWNARAAIVLSGDIRLVIDEFLTAKEIDPVGNWILRKFLRSFYPWVPERLDQLYQVMNEVGVSKMGSADFRDSDIILNEALTVLPTRKEAYKNLGILYLRSGEPEQARATLEQAARIDPSDTEILYNLALAYYKTGSFEQAALYFSETLNRDPHNEESCLKLTDIYLNSGRKKEARKVLEDFLKGSPENERIREYLKKLR